MASTALLTALKDPSARLTQHLILEVSPATAPLEAVDFTMNEEMNEEFHLDVVFTSEDATLTGSDFLGKRAKFVVVERALLPYAEPIADPACTRYGVVTQWEFRSNGSSNEISTYWLRIEPRAALLDRVVTSQVFLDKTLKQIFSEVLIDRKHIWPHDIDLNFEGHDERLEQVLMNEESLLALVKRTCRKLGLYYYYTHAEPEKRTHRDSLVIDNRASGYVRAIELPYLAPSGLDGRWHEAVLSIRRVENLMPASVQIREHNYRMPQEPVTAQTLVDYDDKTLFGSIDRSAEGYQTGDEAKALVEVRRQEIVSKRLQFKGKTNCPGLFVGAVLRLTNHKLPGAEYGLVITKLITTGSRTQPVTNEFEASPAHLIWRPEYDPARHWKWMRGTVIAQIESLDKGSRYADLDEHGRYLLDFHFNSKRGESGTNSMRLRFATPSASDQGGFHAPLLPGTWVDVGFENGDIDRPQIVGAHFDYSNKNHVHGHYGWNSRAVWRSPLLSGKLRFEDLKGHEGAKFATTYMQTSVSMGYLVDNQKRKRGEGFEINTAGHGTYHASKGLFFSADAAGANAAHLDMPAAVAQLKAALQRVTELAMATSQAKGDPADKRMQAALLDGLDQLRDAGLLASAPGGMAFVTPKSVQHSAGENVIVTAGRDMDLSITQRLRVVAGDLISLCAHKLGIRIFSKGKIEMQAQDAPMDLFADKQLHVSSANADVLVNGKTKAVLASGGAAIKIENGSVEVICAGDFKIKAGSFTFEGPQNTDTPLPKLPASEFKPTNSYPLTL